MPKAAGPGARRPGDGREGPKRLLALSGAVVMAVYAVGYVRTEGPARQAQAAAAALAQTTGAPTAAAGGPGVSGSATGAASSAVPAGSAAAPASGAAAGGSASAAGGSTKTAATKYRNGSFSATGYGFHGPISVTLVVSGGRIKSASVTACGTTYSCSLMDPLAAQVVSLQGPPVDYIGGATASSDAYYQAVTSALGQAKA